MGYYPRRRVMVGKMFGNVQMSVTLTRNNCPSDTKPTQATYTVPADTYKAKTQLAANNLAQADLNANGQAYANTYGSCLVKTLGPWTLRATPSGYVWSSVCYGNGQFVAVGGSSGTESYVMTSTDGINWTLRPTGLGLYSWVSICYGNGLYVAVSSTGHSMTSSDGINWALHTTPIKTKTVCFGNGKFVATDDNNTNLHLDCIISSTDGANWTVCSIPQLLFLKGVCYGDGKFVITTSNFKVILSSDGINWTLYDTSTVLSYIFYGNGLYVTSELSYSTDAINWQPGTYQYASVNYISVCFGDGMYVTVGYNNNAPANRAQVSSDGKNWTVSPSNFSQNFWSVCYGNGLFVAVASNVASGGAKVNMVMTATWGF